MVTQSIVLAIVTQLTAIEGQVRDARTHAIVPLARVELMLAQTPVERQYTDGEGRFRFGHLTGRNYTLSVDHSGYEPSFIGFDVLISAPLPLTIDLIRKRPRAGNAQPVISVREYLVPKAARKEFDRARLEVQRQNCTKAIVHFEKGLRTFAEEASAHNDLGNCYRRLGQLDRAESSFRRAWDLSDSPYIALNLSEVYLSQKRFAEAETVLLEAVRKQPDAGDAYYGLSLLYAAQGLWEKTEASARQAESRPHRIADLHFVLAELYCAQRNSAAAIRQLDLYLSEAPDGTRSEQVRQALARMSRECRSMLEGRH